MLTVFFIMMASVSIIACLYLGVKLDKRLAYEFVSDSNTFLAFAIGFCSFMFFKDLKIKQSRAVNNIGGSTFGILCIHANSHTMMKWLWETVLNVRGAYSLPIEELILFSVLSVIIVFTVGLIIATVRQKCIEKPYMKINEKNRTYKKVLSIFESA